MLWVMTTTDKYEFPLCVEGSAEALARKMGVSASTVRTTEMRGRKYGQRADGNTAVPDRPGDCPGKGDDGMAH